MLSAHTMSSNPLRHIMFEPNATVITVRIREATHLQVKQVLDSYKVSSYDYIRVEPMVPGDPIIGRYEVVISDTEEVDAERLAKAMLRAATGYELPDAQVIMQRAYFTDNA